MPINSWPRLIDAAKQALRQPLSLGKANDFLFFIYEPTFDNEFSLWLALGKDQCHWESRTWEKDTDSSKFGVLEQLRYLGQTLSPTVCSVSGICAREQVQPIITLLELQSPAIRFTATDSIVLDGEKTTLTIGNGDWKVTYTWTVLPPEWSGFETAKELLIQLNNRLVNLGPIIT